MEVEVINPPPLEQRPPKVFTAKSASAQDLFLHSLVERGCGVGIAAEPYRVPRQPCWASDERDSVAITWNQLTRPCIPVERGTGWVCVKWGPLFILGVYASPALSLLEFEERLDTMSAFIRARYPQPFLIAGDFNAKSPDWAASEPIDEVDVGGMGCRVGSSHSQRGVQYLLCVERRLHSRSHMDLLCASFCIYTWLDEPIWDSALDGAAWLCEIISGACEVAMPRSGPRVNTRAYWWSEEIATLRRFSVQTQRRYTRAKRRRHGTVEDTTAAYEAYRDARRALRLAIKQAKTQAWDELLQSIDEDPWGRPYRIVTGRLRPRAPPATESLEPHTAASVVDRLFPPDTGGETYLPPLPSGPSPDWIHGACDVTEEELTAVVRRIRPNKAPGPDGVPGGALALALVSLAPRAGRIFTSLLRDGVFPPEWRRANLVLIPKPGRAAGEPSAYRPICLLDEVGKVYERIISCRLIQHINKGDPPLQSEQFGFREGKSTIDAIASVRALAESTVEEGSVLLAVSLDISNAFNTLPWKVIRDSLEYFRVPNYLRRVIGQYLNNRNWEEARALAEVATSMVCNTLAEMGLEVAANKTEALWFMGHSVGPPPPSSILIGGVPIQGQVVRCWEMALLGQLVRRRKMALQPLELAPCRPPLISPFQG
ncbi:uncharacterized protein [Cardiocondyla obscurior]|uniref:uncharacterized protein n=1 Tax=Cardiocondyla obscurior TaxID=286306 RepID=UPI00396586A4